MAELALGFALDGLSLDRALAGLLGGLDDLGPAMDGAGAILARSVMENFLEQGRPERWRPLMPKTVRRKGGDAVLIDTGRLMGSVRYAAGPGRVEVSAPIPYAQYAQADRPFLIIQDEDAAAVVGAVEEYLLSVSRRYV